MRLRSISILVVLVLAAAAVLAAVVTRPAGAYPTYTQVCSGCHSGTPSGTVSATPSTTTPAAGATYNVAISIGLTANGSTGFRIAETDASGTGTTFTAVSGGGPGTSATTFTASMTAPTAPGTYYYKVWTVKGPNNSSGMAQYALYSITVPAPPAATAAISGLTPNHAQTGASVVIAGSNLGVGGMVRFGTTVAPTSAWSATSVTATVPVGLAPGSVNVTVTPTGGTASNALAFTVDAPPAATAAISGLTPNHAQTGASVVIAGSNLGVGGMVRFGTTVAPTSAWSATSVTATVPVGLAPGSVNVTVTPTGGTASNALAFTVDAPPAGADTTPPTTTASGLSSGSWCSGSFLIHLTATDNVGGSGVASITYSVDGGKPVTVHGSTADVTSGGADSDDEDDVDARALSGTRTITFYATDVAGNKEAAQTLVINIDASKPSTRAPKRAVARRHHRATLRYEVRDAVPNGGTAKVVIVIKNRRGKVVKRLHLGNRPVNRMLTTSFRCSLRPGIYRFYVKATDKAGNHQARIARQRLIVRS